MTLRSSVVDTLSLWNSTAPSNNGDNDFLFVQFLLIDQFGGQALAHKQLDGKILQFVKEVFAYRVKDDGRRLASFENIVDKVTDQLSNKLMATNDSRRPSIRLSF